MSKTRTKNLKVFGSPFFKKIGVISYRSHFAGIYGSARSCFRRNNRISRLARVETQGIWVESEANDESDGNKRDL